MRNYIIVGDTAEFTDCLITVCYSEENARETLGRMLTNPNDNDRRSMEGVTNLRIEVSEGGWWNDPLLVN